MKRALRTRSGRAPSARASSGCARTRPRSTSSARAAPECSAASRIGRNGSFATSAENPPSKPWRSSSRAERDHGQGEGRDAVDFHRDWPTTARGGGKASRSGRSCAPFRRPVGDPAPTGAGHEPRDPIRTGVAIVTGAGGGGLGRTYALELARRGCAVVVNDPGCARATAAARRRRWRHRRRRSAPPAGMPRRATTACTRPRAGRRWSTSRCGSSDASTS